MSDGETLQFLNGTVIQNATTFNKDLCNLDICPLSMAQYAYVPSLAANATLAALFGLSLLLHLGQGIYWKTWGFTIAFTLGNTTEVIGYIGRIMSHFNPFTSNPFMIQIICLTFAPAFLTAGIYLCLSRIVVIFGEDISRIKPKFYTYIFMTCDIISLILQSAGGALAATADTSSEQDNGTHVMVGGLVFQVVTMSLFMALCAEYAWRVMRSDRPLNAYTEKLRSSRRFTGFLVALALSTLLIYVRSIYRAVELAEGWNGFLISKETYFIVLEGVLVTTSVLVMNVFCPGMCFGDAYALGGKGGNRPGTAGTNTELKPMSEYSEVPSC